MWPLEEVTINGRKYKQGDRIVIKVDSPSLAGATITKLRERVTSTGCGNRTSEEVTYVIDGGKKETFTAHFIHFFIQPRY